MKSGFGGRPSYIVVFILLMLFAIRFGAVMAAGIDIVNLLSPGNATWTNQNNDTIVFEFNYTGGNATALCKLYVSNTTFYYFLAAGQNASVYNATNTTLYSNLTIQDGTIKWYVNCTNGTTMPSDIFLIYVDRTQPFTTINKPANSTINSDLFNFTYITYNESSLNCSWYSIDENTNVTNCSITGNHWAGNFSGLSDGSHNITVWANDSAGNLNSTDMRYWIRDTIAPPIYVISPGNNTYSNATIALNVSSDGTEYGWKSRLNGASNWSFTPNVTIEANEGGDNVTIWVNDSAGNENSTTVYFTIDLTNPAPVIISPMETTYSANPQLNFSYIEVRPDACWYSLNGSANVTLASCNTNGTVLVSSQGANNVTLCMNDTSGRMGCDFVNYIKDTNPPSITIYAPANTSYRMQNINFSVNLNKIGDVCLVDYGSGNKTMNSDGSKLLWNHTNATLPEGIHQAIFYCNDTAGTGNTTSIVFTVDLTLPSIITQSPLNQTYNTSSIWFNVTASVDVDMCLVEHTKVGTGPWTNRTMTNSSGSWNRQNTTMAEGQHRVKYYCNDTAGNWNSTGYVYFTSDTTAPAVTILDPANSTINSDAFSFSYYESPNCSWYSVDGGGIVANCSFSLAWWWTGVLSSLSDGQHNITVWANDTAGNENSTTRYWIRDTITPSITILLPQNITYNTTSIPLNVSSDGSEQAWEYSLNGAENHSFTPNTSITAQYGSNVLVIYVNDSANNINASQVTFFVNNTAPRLEASGHYATGDGGWGENHTFYVNCSDADSQNVSLYLWYRKNPGDSWTLLGNHNCSGVSPQTSSFLISTFTCSNITAAGQNSSYKFNATDASSLTNQTDPQNFTITKDDVSFQPASGYNNSAMWRNNSANYDLFIRVRLYDTDRGQYLTGGNATVWVTKNASNPNSWDTGKALSVNSSGYLSYQFSNDSEMLMHECNYTVGLHNWTAGVGGIYEDSCYETTNSSTYNLSIWSDLRPRIASPVATEGFLQGDLINISGYVDDDCTERTGQKVEGISVGSPAPRYVLVGESGSPTRYCTSNWQEGSGWYNCSWDSTGQLRVRWNVTMSVNKGYYAPNSTMEGYAFHLGTAPSLSSPGVSPNVSGWNQRFSFTVYFADADSENNNISLWKSFDNITWNYVDSQERSSSGTTLTFYEYFTCPDSLPYPGRLVYYKFNTTDAYNFTAGTSPLTLNITSDNVTVEIDASGSSGNVSLLNATATLRFRIYDVINASYKDGVSGLVWVTENGSNYTRVLNCTTAGGGYCQVSYNPNASSSATGIQYWKGGTNDSCYEYLNSTSQALNVTNPIASTGIYPRVIVNDSAVNLSISASNFQAIWANVTRPDSNVAKTTLTNNANTSFSSTPLVGRYNVTFYANDSLGEIANSTGSYFEAFPPVAFNMSVINQSSDGVNSSVIFYSSNDTIAYNSSVNGSYHSILADTLFDIEIRAYDDRLQLRLNGINLSSENNESLGIDKHTLTSGYLVTYGINTTYNSSRAALRIYYDDLSYSDEANLKLYKCANYSFSSRSCLGSWEDVSANATQNTTGHYFVINVSSFSGFGVFQYTAPSPPSGSPGVTGGNCTINWSCSGWEPCRPTGTQIRICRDTGPCKTGNRTETRNCSYAVPSSCYDKILNQDESDVDCGGHCSPCGSGKACRANPDCQGALCENGLCRASAAPGEKPTAKTQETGEQTASHWIFDTGMLVMVVALAIILALAIFSCIKLLLPAKKEAEGNEQAKT